MWSIIFLKEALFFSNFLLSSFSCVLISSFPMKIPSKYIHFFCTWSHTSMHSEIKLSPLSQYLILELNAPAYLLDATVCKFANWSSKSSFFSSVFVNTHPLSSFPFLYFARSKFYFFQTCSILLSSYSFLNYWMASLTIYPTIYSYFCRFKAKTWSNVIVLIETSNLLPVCFISFSQCLSVIDPFFNRIIKGIEFLKATIF